MKLFSALFVALIAMASPALAEVKLTDYKGNVVRLEEGDVKSNGGFNIHYYTVGNGPVLIISHGAGDSWISWAHQLHMLSQRYKVVVYDLRNNNKSDKLPGVENNVNARFEEDLLAVQNHFTDGPAIHMGHDQGGMVLWMYAMKYPEKVRLLIQTNAIHPRAFIRELANGEQAKLSYYIQEMIEFGKRRNAVEPPREPAMRKGATPELHQMRLEIMKRTGAEGRQGTVDWYRANFPAKPYTPGSRAFGSWGVEFPHVKAPTLVIAAENDIALHPAGYNDLGTWIDADYTYVAWDDTSHWHNSEDPAKFNRMIAAWLNLQEPNLPPLKE